MKSSKFDYPVLPEPDKKKKAPKAIRRVRKFLCRMKKQKVAQLLLVFALVLIVGIVLMNLALPAGYTFFGLTPGLFTLLIFCLVAGCAFEFVNGFHDTANAVATVIYTNSLNPWVAVVWSGICNFVGVFAGGIAVAMGIVNLLPVEALIDQNVYHGIAMIMALLLSAIFWNLLTWYYGIPCSSSHTLVASILGVGLAYSLLPENTSGAAINWSKASDIGLSLLISPFCGFTLTILMMFLLRLFFKGDTLFKEPHSSKAPPAGIRATLILTCTGVSFFHGSNDGQKGVGLVMLILIGILPAYFALSPVTDPKALYQSAQQVAQAMNSIDPMQLSAADREKLTEAKSSIASLSRTSATLGDAPMSTDRFEARRDILKADRLLTKLYEQNPDLAGASNWQPVKTDLKKMRSYTDYAPKWVILMISLSLGLGTMVGWQRIVRTIGEKIGKQHLTYAQGASAEMVAAGTIGLSTYLGLPVSTTQVLSSGIAGSMVASKGVKNLQAGTIKSIFIAWVLTLPVVLILSGGLFLLFRWFL